MENFYKVEILFQSGHTLKIGGLDKEQVSSIDSFRENKLMKEIMFPIELKHSSEKHFIDFTKIEYIKIKPMPMSST